MMREDERLTDSPIMKKRLKTILKTANAIRRGDRAARFPEGVDLIGEIGEALNDIIKTRQEVFGPNDVLSRIKTNDLLQKVKLSNFGLEVQAKELEEKAEQLALISKYKSEFLANMSHELRTPLNSLLILSKILSENKDGNLSSEQIRFANTIHSAGCDLLTLINDILDLAKVEAGKTPVWPQNINLKEVEAYLTQLFLPMAENKGVKFEIKMSENIPATIYTDGNRFQQILRNLLSNALKFTEKGSVTLEGYAAPNLGQEDGSLKSMIAFSVKDTGTGIPKEKQKLIFEAFQQVDGTTNRKYGGTGLGLTISREISALLGGFVQLKSKVGEGSVFTLYLPEYYTGPNTARTSDDADPEHATPPLPADADFSGKKILIIDNDARNIYALVNVLKSQNMRLICSKNGREGIERLVGDPGVDMVLMDTMMPEMDGLEAIRLIRSMPKFRHLPIISVTAKAMKGDREECLKAGASDYITKPIEVEKLLSLMHLWLGKPNSHGVAL